MPERETIKILALGNSFTQDALAYVPFLFERMNPTYNLHLELACIGGGSLEDHLTYMREDKEYGCNVYWPGAGVWDGKPRRASELLEQEWDLILFNQRSTQATDYATYDETLPELVAFVTEHQRNRSTLGWLITHALPEKNHLTLFEQQCACVQRVYQDYPFDVILPCGTATENARQTSLNGISDGKFLTCEDNWHLQDGLPCLTEAYAATATLFHWFDIKGSKLDPYFLEPDFLVKRQIPGVNGTLIRGDMEENLLAFRCALAAVKQPYKVSRVEQVRPF